MLNIHRRLPRCLVDRQQYLMTLCKGKRVLHLGCLDFATPDGYEGRFQQRANWLHDRLALVASELVGIDNAKEAIEDFQSRYHRTDIQFGDAEHLDRLNLGQFDVVVAGEIFEHLPNPGCLLKSACTVLKSVPDKGILVITTTNAYCLRRFVRIPFGRESVHPDHVAYYSHQTLSHLCAMHGYAVLQQCSYRLPNRRPFFPYIVERVASMISPNLTEGLICVAQQQETSAP